MILLLISFVGGVLTVLAPCILPILPVVVGGSVSDGKDRKKILTVVLSLGFSVLLFTLLLKVSTACVSIPDTFWKWFSGGILSVLGLVMVFPNIWENQITANLSIKSNILLGKGVGKKSFLGDILTGFALGPVFSTCSPTYFIVLATVLPANFLLGLIYLVAYTIGLCLSLFVVAFFGQKIVMKLEKLSDSKGITKRVFGILFIIVGIFIISGLDKKIQTSILDNVGFDVTKIEQKLIDKTKI